jgi:predicted ABC-type transport system involved in lysophospholipase L1 biosynthesis ATPase subunit
MHAERGITLLVVTHDANIAHHCQRIIHLKDGEVIAEENV